MTLEELSAIRAQVKAIDYRTAKQAEVFYLVNTILFLLEEIENKPKNDQRLSWQLGARMQGMEGLKGRTK